MKGGRFFVDTAYVIALINARDQYHARALALSGVFRAAGELWITTAVLLEIGNALAETNRRGAVDFDEACRKTGPTRLVHVDDDGMQRGLALYASRPDKGWGLTDCISFEVMREHGLVDAFTNDRHFVQAGFRALLLDGPLSDPPRAEGS